VAKYFVGTAGWSYKDWEGIVYPSVKGAGFHPLVFIGKFITMVEVNSTFYRPPVLHMSLSWIRKVEVFPEFLFAVKLHQAFTHTRKDFSQKDIDEFKTGIEPLRANDRLAAILIQFPWSFANTVANTHYLVTLFERFAGYPLALEVRHGSWADPRFIEILAEHRVCYVNIDQPVIGNSLKPSSLATNSEFAYVRLHGRNYQNWFKEDAGRDARYDYLYTKNELEEWVERIKKLGKSCSKVHIVTNNHYRGQAMANAVQIRNLITGEKLDIPDSLVKEYPILQQIIESAKKGQLNLFSDD